MRRLIIGILVVILFCTACSNKTKVINQELTFKGQTTLWRSQLIQRSNQTWTENSNGRTEYDGYNTIRLTLQYIGPNLGAVRRAEYSYQSSTTGGSGEASVDKNGFVETTGFQSGNGATIPEDDVVKMTVKWNGNRETFNLTQSNQK